MNNKNLDKWRNIIKKLSFRKYGGFTILVTDIIDIGKRTFAMKANIRRLKKRRLVLWGKWRVLSNKLLARQHVEDVGGQSMNASFKLRKLTNKLLMQDRINVRTRMMEVNMKWRKFANRLLKHSNLKMTRKQKMRRLKVLGKWNIFSRKLLQRRIVNMTKG